MNTKESTIRKILAVLLCLSLLLGGAVSLAEDSKALPAGAEQKVTDNTGPRLTDLVFKQNGKTLKPGQKLNVSVKAADRSGVDSLYVEFYNQKAENWIGVDLHYNAKTDRFEGERELDKTDLNGDYILDYINGRDSFGNEVYCSNGTGFLGKFKLKGASSGSTTEKVPTIKADISLKEAGKTVKPGQDIHVKIKVKSKIKNATWIGFSLVNEDSGNSWHSYHIQYDPKKTEYEWTISFGYKDENGKLVCNDPNGTYKVVEIIAHEEKSDEEWIIVARTEIDGPTIKLKNSFDDKKAPKISSGKIKQKGKTLKAGDKLEVSVKITDDSEVTYAYAYLLPTDGKWDWNRETETWRESRPGAIYIDLEKASGNTWKGTYILPKDIANGKYYLNFEARDRVYNWTWKDFPKQTFTFKDGDYVTDDIRNFIGEVANVLQGDGATEKQVNDYGMKLAEGKWTGVQVIKAILADAKLSTADQVARLYQLMTGKAPTAAEQAEWEKKLNGGTSVEVLIDKLAASEAIRQLSHDSSIQLGSFGAQDEGVEIGDIGVKKVKLNKTKATLKKGKTLKLKATVTPKNATNAKVKWTTSDKKVAKVNSKGKVTAVGEGTCVITCQATDGSGKKATCKITVSGSSKKEAGTALKVSKDKLSLKVGKTKTLTVEPEGTEVKWSTSDKKVAKVNAKGKVTAVGEGTCVITCEAADGTKVEIPVKVTKE